MQQDRRVSPMTSKECKACTDLVDDKRYQSIFDGHIGMMKKR